MQGCITFLSSRGGDGMPSTAQSNQAATSAALSL